MSSIFDQQLLSLGGEKRKGAEWTGLLLIEIMWSNWILSWQHQRTSRLSRYTFQHHLHTEPVEVCGILLQQGSSGCKQSPSPSLTPSPNISEPPPPPHRPLPLPHAPPPRCVKTNLLSCSKPWNYWVNKCQLETARQTGRQAVRADGRRGGVSLYNKPGLEPKADYFQTITTC